MISTGENQNLSKIKDFFRRHPYKFPVLIDTEDEHTVRGAYEAHIQPTTFFIEPDKTIARKWVWFERGQENELQGYIHRTLLKAPLPERRLIVLRDEELDAASDVKPPDPDDFFENSSPMPYDMFLDRLKKFEDITVADWDYDRRLKIAKADDYRLFDAYNAGFYYNVTYGYLDNVLYMPTYPEVASIMLGAVRDNYVQFCRFNEDWKKNASTESRRQAIELADKLDKKVNRATEYLKAIIAGEYP